MSSFDDTILKAKEMLDIAAKKTDEFVSVSKQKIKISSLSSDLKTAYAKLGKRCYTELKNNEVDDPEVAALIEEIKGYIAEIKALKDEVDNIELGQAIVTFGNLVKGFEYPDLKVCVISDKEVFGEAKKVLSKNKNKKKEDIV